MRVFLLLATVLLPVQAFGQGGQSGTVTDRLYPPFLSEGKGLERVALGLRTDLMLTPPGAAPR